LLHSYDRRAGERAGRGAPERHGADAGRIRAGRAGPADAGTWRVLRHAASGHAGVPRSQPGARPATAGVGKAGSGAVRYEPWIRRDRTGKGPRARAPEGSVAAAVWAGRSRVASAP